LLHGRCFCSCVLSWSILSQCAFRRSLSHDDEIKGAIVHSGVKPFITAQCFRVWSWKAFVIVSAVTFLMFCLMNIGILDVNNQGDPCLKGRITHSFFISLNFLMIGVQLGLIGLFIYLGSLANQFFLCKETSPKVK
jgi:hypothetical protein